jgi:NAD(P)-dependent dehydrogenase (short-subunit alcohol dehydrogenase family)
MKRFAERVVLITGGGHGIGRACSRRLAAEGAAVAVADIDHEAGTSVATDLRESGGAAHAVHCDVTEAQSVANAVAEAVARFGRLDVLVNTAGGDRLPPDPEDSDDGHWAAMLDLNLVSVVRCVRAALPHLLSGRRGSSVVTVGSINGLVPAGSEPYSAAKAGLEILTRNLAARHSAHGVRFNLIAPGTIRTRVWDEQPAELARLTSMYPLGRVGEPDDVAAAAAFLASDDAAWITGVTLPVDGGLLAVGPIR